MSIITTTPKWWEIQNIPTEIVYELRRRKNANNMGFNVPNTISKITYEFEKNHKDYKGPMTPWVRIFSNSTGKPSNFLVPSSKYLLKNGQIENYDGFILFGGEGFFDAWGYKQNKPLKESKSIIGYWANGKTPHYIDNEQYRSQYNYSTINDEGFPQNNTTIPFVPPPSIESVNIKQSKELLTFSSFKFKCFGLAQLEYLTPFFLTPGVNIFIEIGWNLFNQKSLVKLDDLDECWKIVSNPQSALDRSNISYGNYGCVTGIITKYNFNTNDGFVYDCNVEITSRQSLYAGMPINSSPQTINDPPSNPTSNNDGNTSVDESSVQFLDLKTFVIRYFPDIITTLENENGRIFGGLNVKNFFEYVFSQILSDLESIPNPKPPEFSSGQQTSLQTQQFQLAGGLGGIGLNPSLFQTRRDAVSVKTTIPPNNNDTQKIQSQTVNELLENYKKGTFKFYDGKSEDRVFCGRRESVYKNPKNPDFNKDVERKIEYGSFNGKTQISDADMTLDFDVNDPDDVWVQLDFLFEVFNIFMSNRSNLYKIDIGDQKINAHPNLISCDKRVLIPNPHSPKVNIGTPGSKTNLKSGGFLRGDKNSDVDKNLFLKQQPDFTYSPKDVLSTYQKYEEIKQSKNVNLTLDDGYRMAALKARRVFKTRGYVRDDLDVIINHLYYKNKKNESAAFPTKENYYEGYIKHLYINVKTIIDLFKDESIKSYKELVTRILQILNESVGGFWSFDVVPNIDGKGLSIVDKNYINFKNFEEIYTFELGSSNNVLKNINFDVSLSNEQAINVLFGSTNNNNLLEKFKNQISEAKAKQDNLQIQRVFTIATQTSLLYPLKFSDRLDTYIVSGSLVSAAPGVNDSLVNVNKDIENLQCHGDKKQDGILCVTVDNITSGIYKTLRTRKGEIVKQFDKKKYDEEVVKNYKFLCLSPNMKSKLRSMIDDGDIRNNKAYSGVADNFQITLTFDGIFSFRNLQVFAINNLPKPYVPGNVIFQVLEVEHTISSGKWNTVVTALVRAIGNNNLKYVLI